MTIEIIFSKKKLPKGSFRGVLLIRVGALLLLPLMEYVAAQNPLHNLETKSSPSRVQKIQSFPVDL